MNTELGLRERKKQQTRRAISDAAMRLFLERGFDQVSVAEVARAADVSEETVFNYFPTKEDLVYERMDTFEHELLAAVRERPVGESRLARVRPLHPRPLRQGRVRRRQAPGGRTDATRERKPFPHGPGATGRRQVHRCAGRVARRRDRSGSRRHRTTPRRRSDDGLPSLADRVRPPASLCHGRAAPSFAVGDPRSGRTRPRRSSRAASPSTARRAAPRYFSRQS